MFGTHLIELTHPGPITVRAEKGGILEVGQKIRIIFKNITNNNIDVMITNILNVTILAPISGNALASKLKGTRPVTLTIPPAGAWDFTNSTWLGDGLVILEIEAITSSMKFARLLQ